MDRQQRYCVSCARAARRRRRTRASRYFAAASRQRRPARRGRPRSRSRLQERHGRAAAVFFFALLPIAVAVGVLVGRGGRSGDEDKLLAALREGNVDRRGGRARTPAPAETVVRPRPSC